MAEVCVYIHLEHVAEVCVCSGVFHYELRWKIVCFIYCIIYVIMFLLQRLLCAHAVIDYDLDVCIHTPHVCPRAHGCLHAYMCHGAGAKVGWIKEYRGLTFMM